MSEFETGRAIVLKEAGWSNRLIARHLCRSDAAIRRRWQKWVNNGSMQRQDGSGRPRETTEREDRAIVRMAVAAPESTLSTIQRVTGTQVSKMTINRRLRERNLSARRPLRFLPLTLVHRQVRLQWCQERSTWNCADWGRIVFSDESRFLLCPDDRRKRVWRRSGQRVDPGLTVEHHTGPQQGVMVWGAISIDSRTPLVVIPGTLTAQRRFNAVTLLDRYPIPRLDDFHHILKVLARADKYFTLKVKVRNVTISIDRLRPAYLLTDSDNLTSEHPPAARPIMSGALPSTSSQQNPDLPDVEKYTEFQGTGSAPDLPRTRSGRIIKKPVEFKEQ
ncbi:Transposase [Cordylochernes scorpioides]|uniref:Transposase n=1 Tax=Cordylochernes scorpioides TaxID=51811 RepID=A0ABY6LJE3_9ARAC|nr:Transposase [Cordylochernes scorpioides]